MFAKYKRALRRAAEESYRENVVETGDEAVFQEDYEDGKTETDPATYREHWIEDKIDEWLVASTI